MLDRRIERVEVSVEDRRAPGHEHMFALTAELGWVLMTDIQPELWVDHASAAVEFYGAAFGATVLHRVGEGDDIVVEPAPVQGPRPPVWVGAGSEPSITRSWIRLAS